jgi:hypothetical protein
MTRRKADTVASEAVTEVIPPAKEDGGVKRALTSWNGIEIMLLIALVVCVIALSVVTIAAGNESAAETGLRGVIILLAGALTGLKVKGNSNK